MIFDYFVYLLLAFTILSLERISINGLINPTHGIMEYINVDIIMNPLQNN